MRGKTHFSSCFPLILIEYFINVCDVISNQKTYITERKRVLNLFLFCIAGFKRSIFSANFL